MKASELTKANIGDTIVIRGVVLDVNISSLPVSVRSKDGGDFCLHFDTEFEIVERPFKIGDEVMCRGYRYAIRAIDEKELWLQRGVDKIRITARITEVSRVAS